MQKFIKMDDFIKYLGVAYLLARYATNKLINKLNNTYGKYANNLPITFFILKPSVDTISVLLLESLIKFILI